jgi:ADP-dependent phosphofructokinase/glucokinase
LEIASIASREIREVVAKVLKMLHGVGNLPDELEKISHIFLRRGRQE